MKRFYTGIGSRTTPANTLTLMKDFAARLERIGFILRSGGAEGADRAFEDGVICLGHKQILRPKDATPKSMEAAAQIHPAWHACNEHARKLHGRNVQLVLGKFMNEPSEFVLAWTPSEEMDGGGTRTGLICAKQNNIPVFHLLSEEGVRKAYTLVEILENAAKRAAQPHNDN